MIFFPVIYSSLSANALLEHVIEQYNLSPDFEICFIKRGFNDTYLIENKTQKFILRVYKHNWRSKKSIENELNLLLFLSQNNSNVSVPLTDINKNLIQSINAPEGIRYLALFTFAKGDVIRKLSAEQSYLLGAETAKIHSLTINKAYDETAFNYGISEQFDNAISVVSRALQNNKQQLDYLSKLKNEFELLFSSINSNEIASGICHGDLQAENFHIENNLITFFDFDFFGKGHLVYDIGVFMWYDQKNKNRETIQSFLNGYQTFRKLTKTELKLLPYFSTLRALFQMSLFCEISDGKQLPIWPATQVADFIKKIERWHNNIINAPLFF